MLGAKRLEIEFEKIGIVFSSPQTALYVTLISFQKHWLVVTSLDLS